MAHTRPKCTVYVRISQVLLVGGPRGHELVKVYRVAFPHDHPPGPALVYCGTI
jgi:hypothetical protein